MEPLDTPVEVTILCAKERLTMGFLFVIDRGKQPLKPVHPGRARLRLSAGKAACEPGGRSTGLALVNGGWGVLFPAELIYRDLAIYKILEQQRTGCRGRRQRKTRDCMPRFAHRRQGAGSLPGMSSHERTHGREAGQAGRSHWQHAKHLRGSGLVQASGLLDIQIKHRRVQGISHRFCTHVQR